MNEKILVTKSSMPPIEEYIEMIRPLWDSHMISNMGMYHVQLENKLKEYLGVDYLSLMVNGHTALEMAIQLMNFTYGSEVITTPFTFISTTHAIIRNGLKPVFCDIKDDFTIDENKIEDLVNENTVAIIGVHVFGNPCHIERINEIASKYGLKVIYDAAHAFGETYNGQGIGEFGDLSIFSFHATKVYNTIEGGAVCCRTKDQYENLYNLKNFGIRSEELIVSVGSNAKMNEFQAAMGLCNLCHIEEEIQKRMKVCNLYRELLNDEHSIHLNTYKDKLKPNYSYFPIVMETREMRDRIYKDLKENNIDSRKYFYPLTCDAACFKNKYRDSRIENARYISNRILVLPLYAGLSDSEVQKVVNIVRRNCF